MGRKIQLGSGDAYLLDNSNIDIRQRVIDYLYNVLNLSEYKYRLMDIDKLTFLQQNEHYVTLNYKGLNYFLIFMTIVGKHYSILIDRRKLTYYKHQLDLNLINIIKIFITTSPIIFSGSIFEGKLIQKENKSYFLIHDCYQIMNKKILDMDLKEKMLYLNEIIENNNFTSDNFTIKLNTFYEYEDLPNLISKLTNAINGLIFYPKKSGINILYLDKKIDKTKPENNKKLETIESGSCKLIHNYVDYLKERVYDYETNESKKVLWIHKTNIPDVYFLYENKNDEIKIGRAHIPNIKTSLYCAEFITTEKVPINCIWNSRFQKYIPLRIVNS